MLKMFAAMEDNLRQSSVYIVILPPFLSYMCFFLFLDKYDFYYASRYKYIVISIYVERKK
jgi:hypothetical protein